MEIYVPERMMPTNKDNNDCECMSREHLIKYKKGVMKWLAKEQDVLNVGDELCEVEIEKKIFTIVAPASGILAERYVEEQAEFSCREPICRLEVKE